MSSPVAGPRSGRVRSPTQWRPGLRQRGDLPGSPRTCPPREPGRREDGRYRTGTLSDAVEAAVAADRAPSTWGVPGTASFGRQRQGRTLALPAPRPLSWPKPAHGPDATIKQGKGPRAVPEACQCGRSSFPPQRLVLFSGKRHRHGHRQPSVVRGPGHRGDSQQGLGVRTTERTRTAHSPRNHGVVEAATGGQGRRDPPS